MAELIGGNGSGPADVNLMGMPAQVVDLQTGAEMWVPATEGEPFRGSASGQMMRPAMVLPPGSLLVILTGTEAAHVRAHLRNQLQPPRGMF